MKIIILWCDVYISEKYFYYYSIRNRALQVKLCASQKDILTSQPQDFRCDLLWKRGLYGGHQVKMWSLGWALVLYDYSCSKKGKWTCIEGRWCEDTEGEEDHPQAKGRGLEQILFSQPPGGDSQPPELWGIHFSCSSHPVCGTLLWTWAN